MSFQDLPEDWQFNILSLTSPADAARLSVVSKAFRTAADSDAVWNRFLPSDLSSIIPLSSFASLSKKSLYVTLSDHPVIIQNSTKSFQLEKWTGNKIYMLSARDIEIIWVNEPHYWEWITLPQSRFEEVARLRAVCWFHLSGLINPRDLSPNIRYAAFLVFQLDDARGFGYDPMVLSVGIFRGPRTLKNVCLDPSLEDHQIDHRFLGLQRPYERTDGWLEIEMGEFLNSGLEGDIMQMEASETTSTWWKHGFILEGIEVRPKYV
ncbi:unnamed protein product [Sphenostylis stenocarpa]|uniref:F-box domain-containing protein n=1 Tax=Sphenostylis stenocarpa TaxID=92480 RepID=A0AA86TCG0_9FABA|nr:unnamed protein product [Sphenostylis stenocarpa]